MQPSGDEQKREVRAMFDRISGVYDFLNHLLSFNLDRLWRRHLAQAIVRDEETLALDICCGTGDTSLELARRMCKNSLVVGVDFAGNMLARMRRKVARREQAAAIRACLGDAMRLPFADEMFDTACCGFGVRNLPDRRGALREMVRVVRPGGVVGILEFMRPEKGLLRRPALFYLRRILPLIGRLVSGDEFNAYGYLPDSIMEFPTAEEFRRDMLEAGCQNAACEVNKTGVVAFFIGTR